jgi:hypothetical protein
VNCPESGLRVTAMVGFASLRLLCIPACEWLLPLQIEVRMSIGS